MIENAVNYPTGKIRDKVNSYNILKDKDKSGEYWNNQDDELLSVKKYIKEHYIKIQDYECAYCKQKIVVRHNASWDTDHIIPKDKYPKFLFNPENLCISCKDCNREKLNKNVLINSSIKRFPKNSKDYLFVHPHFDDYNLHIKKLDSSLFFIPKDKKGVKTIEICGLLRFVYQYSNYGNISLDFKIKIGELHNELMNTTDPITENFLLTLMGDISKSARDLATQKVLSDII